MTLNHSPLVDLSYALKGVFVSRKLWQNKLQWNVNWVRVVIGQLLTVSDVSTTCAMIIISIIITDGGLSSHGSSTCASKRHSLSTIL